VVPHYNVMGVAKAALEGSGANISPIDLGPEGHPCQRHLGRPDQDAGRQRHRRLPLHPEVERAEQRRSAAMSRIEQVGGAGLYLLSDLGSPASPARSHHVDAGYNVIGMKAEDAPDIALA
jgi:enoyl-[acyl-carrier protein] reductase I